MVRILSLSLALLTVGGAIAFAQSPGGTSSGGSTPGGTPQVQPGNTQTQQGNTNTNQPNNGNNTGSNVNAARQAQARGNANFQFGGINERPWFSDPGVRRELGLQDNQFNTMNERYGQLYRQYNSDLNALRQQNLPANELRSRSRDLQQRFNQEFSTGLNDYFPDERARNRYQQLNFQYQDLGAFSNPQIQQRLNLTAEQQSQLDDLQNDWNTRMNRFSELPADQRGPEAFNRLQSERSRQLQGILNEQQMRDWRTLTGNPYSFSSDVYFSGSSTTGQGVGTTPGRGTGTSGGTGTGGTGTGGTGASGTGTTGTGSGGTGSFEAGIGGGGTGT